MKDRKMPKESISIFFPCYNDSATIGSLIANADAVAQEFTDDYEIIVVDDGSTDQSRQILLSLKEKYGRLRLIFHEANRGYGAVLKSGFYNATKELVFYTDGDGQYDVYELRKLIPVMQEGIDTVNGYKIMRADHFYRKIIGKFYLWITRLLFNFHVKDVNCDFRLIRRRVFDNLSLEYNSGIICVEMIKKMEDNGCRFAEVAVSHYYRQHGRSQFFNFQRIFAVAKDILKLWWEIMICKKIYISYKHGALYNILRMIIENNFKVQKKIVKKELISNGKGNILDIGCGTGILSCLFDGADYTGIDISPACINYAIRKYRRNFEIMDATQLKFSDSSFDNILIFGIIHHFNNKNARTVISEVRRVLKEKGKVIAIEDVPTISRFNIFGKVMHYFDWGKFIRPLEEYRNLFSEYLYVDKFYPMRSGVCDYAVFILKKE